MWYQQGRPGPPSGVGSASTYSPAQPYSPGKNGDGVSTLFEGHVPVVVQREGKEPATEVFVVGVMAGGTFPLAAPDALPAPSRQEPPGTSSLRAVHLRVTSPSDPFFLHTAFVTEDEYPRFKESNGLRFDFVKFPSVLVKLLKDRMQPGDEEGGRATPSPVRTTSPPPYDGQEDGVLGRSCRLHLPPQGSAEQGRFSFCQVDLYRDSEVMGITVKHEDDAGQKRYLAARAAKLERQLNSTADELEATKRLLDERTAAFAAAKAELTHDRDRLQGDLDKHTSQLHLEAERREQALVKEQTEQQRTCVERYEARIADLRGRYEDEASRLTAKLEAATAELTELRAAGAEARATGAEQRTQLAGAMEELVKLREKHDVLGRETAELERRLADKHREAQDKTLRVVELEARLDSLTENSGRERTRADDAAATVSELQLEIASWRNQAQASAAREADKDAKLDKSLHIIRTMRAKLLEAKRQRDRLAADASGKQKKIEDLTERSLQAAHDAEIARVEVERQGSTLQRLKEEKERLEKDVEDANSCIQRMRQPNYPMALRLPVTAPSPAALAARVSSPITASTATAAHTPAYTASPSPAVRSLPESHVAPTVIPAVTEDSKPSTSQAKASSPSFLRSSPSRTPSLVMDIVRASGLSGEAHPSPASAGASRFSPSNFFVTEVTGPIGTTA